MFHSDMAEFEFDALHLVRSSLVRRIRKDQLDSLIPVGPHAYISRQHLDLSRPRWDIRRQVNIARAGAAVALSQDRFLTGEAALAIRGLPTWMRVGDIDYRTVQGVGSSKAITAPEARVQLQDGNMIVPSVKTRALRGSRLLSEIEFVHGVPVATLHETALDLARFAHPLTAYVGVSIALRKLAGFDAISIEDSRARERLVRTELLTMLEPIRGKRGYRRARTIIEKADAGVETPPEGVLLWLLHILLRDDHRDEAKFCSQYPVMARGRAYRPDIAFPSLSFYVEFDGRGKLVGDPKAADDFLSRQRDLHAAGWNPVRFSTTNLANIPAMVEALSQELESLGLRVSALGGPLWSPIPNYMRSPARR